jgi:hypothetical protein
MKGEGKTPAKGSGRPQAAAEVGRRDFLRILGAGAGVAAGTGAMVPSAHADSEAGDEKVKARYRETEHVKAYYRVNAYPKKS